MTEVLLLLAAILLSLLCGAFVAAEFSSPRSSGPSWSGRWSAASGAPPGRSRPSAA